VRHVCVAGLPLSSALEYDKIPGGYVVRDANGQALV
jgi:hypothetical protein